jgi:hypothetical protein
LVFPGEVRGLLLRTRFPGMVESRDPGAMMVN